jgi:hypothetical protein
VAIDISSLASEINRQLAEYAHGVGEEVEAISQKLAKDGVSKLKKLNNPKLTGDYRKGWRASKVKDRWIVHNKTDYQLTHLLEKGHAKVGGGRVEAIPHISIVEQEMIAEFKQGVIEVIQR